MSSLPVSVIITTKNEAVRIVPCLRALRDFGEILVVDSGSTDETVALAVQHGAAVVSFAWNGVYPKKRQWCLDHLALRHDWVFFVDADEIVTENLVMEIAAVFQGGIPECAGYFVTGRYVVDGRILRFGLANAKLALFDRRRMAFPVVNDHGLPGMGEMEGHYQPVLREGQEGRICRLKAFLYHHAYDTGETWEARHRRYAAWEAGMNARNAWPADPGPWRQKLKTVFRRMPFRPQAAFCHSFFFKRGFMDGRPGLKFALDRYRYYNLIENIKDPKGKSTLRLGLFRKGSR